MTAGSGSAIHGARIITLAARHKLPAVYSDRHFVTGGIAFLQSLPVTKGIFAGKKMRLLPGQRRFVEAVYGRVCERWPARDTNRDQERAERQRQNRPAGGPGALPFARARMRRRGARSTAAALFNKLQAALIFAEMNAIVEATPEFDARCNLQRYGKVIEVMEGDGAGSIYESLTADDKRAHGLDRRRSGYTTNSRKRRTPIYSTICVPHGEALAKVLA